MPYLHRPQATAEAGADGRMGERGMRTCGRGRRMGRGTGTDDGRGATYGASSSACVVVTTHEGWRSTAIHGRSRGETVMSQGLQAKAKGCNERYRRL
jgi:hypothetical protein